jgi:hypothetical protein
LLGRAIIVAVTTITLRAPAGAESLARDCHDYHPKCFEHGFLSVEVDPDFPGRCEAHFPMKDG